VHFARDHSLMLEGGTVRFPDGSFKGNFVSLMYGWDMDRPALNTRSEIVLTEWEIAEQHYIRAARGSGASADMDNIGLRLNRYLSDWLYLTGQAHTGYRGRAGGYSAGLFGAGLRHNFEATGTSVMGEMLLGAGAGGGIASGGGAIMQPMVFVRQALNETVGLKLGLGRIKSFKGELDSTVVDLSVSMAFGSTKKP
jgi:hypothetical protein